MAELESQPLSDEERAELEELRAEKARREEQEKARREREELAALRAERAKAEEAAANAAPAPKPAPAPKSALAPRPAAAKPVPAAPKPQPKKAARPKSVEPKPSRDEMTFAQRMVTSKEPTGENEIPGMAPAQKIIIVLALIAFVIFMGYTILTSMGLL